MIIARAPLQLNLAGEGTDHPAYADHFGALAISATIDRYVYVVLTRADDDMLHITAANADCLFSQRRHLFDTAVFWSKSHRLPIETLKHFGIDGGCKVHIATELPSGSGLGSTSASAVALTAAVAAHQGRTLSKWETADLAGRIEIDEVGVQAGRLGHFSSACGGLNVVTLTGEETIVTPCPIAEPVRSELQSRLLLFSIRTRLHARTRPISRPAALAAGELARLHTIKALACEMLQAIREGDLIAAGKLFERSGELERNLTGTILDERFASWCEAAQAAGARACKIADREGAFLLLYVEPDHQREVIQRMSALGLVWIDVDFETEGSAAAHSTPDRDGVDERGAAEVRRPADRLRTLSVVTTGPRDGEP